MKPSRLTALLSLIFILNAAIPALAADPPAGAEGKVATVNGIDISRKDYEREVSIYKERLSRSGQPVAEQQIEIMKGQILDQMIEAELLYQDSRNQGVQVEPKEVDNQFNEIRQRFATEKEFDAAMDRMDLTEAAVRQQIERGLAINTLVKTRIADKITISEEESRKFYDAKPELFKQPEEVKASHILIKVAPDADADKKSAAEKKIEKIQARLKKGEDFADLARESSEGPSASKGGDLGYFKRGSMVKPFEDAAFALEVNQVSDLVETRFGYHLIKVFDKKPEQILAYADVKGELEQHLKQQKLKAEVDIYLDNLKKKAKIEKQD